MEWLDENKESKDWFLALKAYYLIEEDCEILKQRLLTGTKKAGPRVSRGEIFYLLGELEELTGNLEEARVGVDTIQAELSVDQARLDLAAAQSALEDLELVAPIIVLVTVFD